MNSDRCQHGLKKQGSKSNGFLHRPTIFTPRILYEPPRELRIFSPGLEDHMRTANLSLGMR